MNIFKTIRLHRRKVAISLTLLFLIPLSPTESLALGSGPSQPEFQEFEPASTTEMVNPFTGDFTYNIPLFELPGPNGGYPFNLAYHAGISVDQEASWVGLGWALNPGAINRQVRGLPDDFNGDEIETVRKMKPSRTYGVNPGISAEIFGGDRLKGKLGVTAMFNNYTGFGYSIDGSIGFGPASGSDENRTLSLGFSLNPDEGLSLEPSLNITGKDQHKNNTLTTIGLGYHSRYGLSDLSFGFSRTKNETITDTNRKGKMVSDDYEYTSSFSSSISLASSGFTPSITHPTKGVNASFTVKGGGALFGAFPNGNVTGFYNVQDFRENVSRVAAYGYQNLQNAEEEDLMDFNRERDGMLHKEAPNLAIPSLTHDVYSVSGQGIGVMFKPLRRDIGVVHDNKVTSKSTAGSLGLDFGPLAGHFGVNLGVMFANKTSGGWIPGGASLSTEFRSQEINSLDEPWYYKVRGEHTVSKKSTYNSKLGSNPIDLQLGGSAVSPIINWGVTGNQATEERDERNNAIIALTNEEILSTSGSSVIK
ncbi:MAG: hypothetical protein AAFO69_17845, partial [Bacteroidota bacterium]